MRCPRFQLLVLCARMLSLFSLLAFGIGSSYNASRSDHVMIAYEQYYHVDSTARQRPVVMIFPLSAVGTVERKVQSSSSGIATDRLNMLWKRALRHPALYSDLFNQNFFCIRNVDSAEAHLTDFGRNALKLYSHKCRNDFKLHDNDIFFQYQQIKNETKKAKKKIRKSENAVQDGGWLYYASLRKVRMRMNGIGIRNNDIEYIVFDNTIMDQIYKYRSFGRPFFIQNAINQSKVFRDQFYRDNFVKNYGGVTLYTNKGKRIRIGNIVENMRLKHYENSGLCTDLKSLHQHRMANLVIETHLLECDYTFFKIPKLLQQNPIPGSHVTITCSLAYVGFRQQVQDKWYAILFGRRKWVLLPPETNLGIFVCNENNKKYTFLINSKEHEHVCDNASKANYSDTLEGLQMQGELIFIPKGWYYAYIDIGETLAVTFDNSLI